MSHRIFDDITELDRVCGAISLRKIFAAGFSPEVARSHTEALIRRLLKGAGPDAPAAGAEVRPSPKGPRLVPGTAVQPILGGAPW